MLHIKLFGTPQVRLNDHPLAPPLVGKELALFAYLVTSSEACLRPFLTDLLWTELPVENAKMNFRTALYNLRRCLGDYLVITREAVALNRRLPYWADVEVFQRVVAPDRSLQAAALSLYQPNFLDGLTVPNASAFDGWLAGARQHLHSQAMMGWQHLVQSYWQAQQYQEGLAANSRLLALEPWNEEAHQQQMRLLAATGQRQVALLHYERCCQILREEVDAPPSPETTALYEQIKTQASVYPVATPPPVTQRPAPQRPAVCIDWGSMPHQPHFYGRTQELATLHQWIVAERCRVVAIIGIGGQGKTALTARFARSLLESSMATPPFEGIIWRSLLQAPPLTTLLQDWLYHLSDQQLVTLPPTLERQFALLADYLQQRRFLFILDNAESLVEAGAGKPEECAAYRQLWQLFQERTHRSCLVVTARTLTASINQQQEQPAIFRRLLLDGLTATDGAQLLKQYGLQGNVTAFTELQQRYSGNPLALTLMAQTIDELFDGDVQPFLQEDLLFFGDIAALLDQQWARLSPLQQELLTWLALEQEPITYEQLWRNLAPSPTKSDYITAIRGLVQRAFIQQQGAALHVQTVILEYTRHRLLETCYQELTDDKVTGWQGGRVTGWQDDRMMNTPLSPRSAELTSKPHLVTLSTLNRYALRKAQAKEYIAANQSRLLVAPLLKRLLAYWGRTGLEKVIRRWLAALRSAYAVGAPVPTGYAAANLFHLLLQLDEEVQGYDFSQLTLRQATLRNARLHNVDLSGATFQECTFTDAFAAAAALAFHPTGQWLAVGAVDGAIHLWRLGEDHFYGRLAGHTDRITALAVSPDGRWLASSSMDCQIDLWEMETHTLRQSWSADVHFVGGLAFSSDGQWLAAPGSDGVVKLYGVTTGVLAYTVASSSRQIGSVAFSPNGQWLAGGSAEGDLYLWAVAALSASSALPPHQQIHGHADSVTALLFSRDGRMLYSGGWDHLIYGWDVTPLASGRPCPTEPMHTLAGHSQPVYALSLSATGQWLASGSADGTVRLWDSQSGALLETLGGHELRVWTVAFQPSAPGQRSERTQWLVSAGNDQRLLTWEIEAQPRAQAPTCRGRLRQVRQGHVDAQRGVAFLPTGAMLISAGYDKIVRVWDWQKGALHATLCRQASGIQNLAISPNGQTVAWSDVDGKLWLWSALRKAGSQKHGSPCDQPPALLAGHTLPIYGLAFHPQGQLLVSASHDQTIRLWDVATGELLQTVTGHACPIWAVAFSPNGQTLASAGHDGAIRLWALRELSGPALHLVQTLTGHRACVRQLAFTPDGEWLVSSACDQTIRLWACHVQQHHDQQYQLRRVLTNNTGYVQALAVSPCRPDGRLTFASCDQQQRLRIWDCERCEVIHDWHEPSGEIHHLTYSPDGTTLAGANRDGYLRLWDVQTGVILNTIQMPKPYAGANITGVMGIPAAQKQTLRRLGAVDAALTAETHTPVLLP